MSELKAHTGYHDTHKTVGAIRAAAFQLSQRMNGTAYKPAARELHDSICRAFPNDPACPVTVPREAADVLAVANAAYTSAADALRWCRDDSSPENWRDLPRAMAALCGEFEKATQAASDRKHLLDALVNLVAAIDGSSAQVAFAVGVAKRVIARVNGEKP